VNDAKRFRNRSVRLLFTGLCTLLYVSVLAANQQNDKQGINITDVEGFLAVRYFYDEQEISNLGNSQQYDVRPTHQQELTLNAEGYIYHPNFLSMDLGGSLLLDQSKFESDQGNNSADEELVSFNTRLDFLKKKPYPFSIYYDKQNPSVSTGLAGRFIQENIKYGFDFALLNPVTPVQITIKAFKETSDGEGFEQIIDETKEQALLKLYYPYGNGSHVQLTHQQNILDSRSGSPDATIVEQLVTTTSTNVDTKNRFGSKNNIHLTTNISNRERDQYPVQTELTVSPNLTWNHSESLDSYYKLNYSDSVVDDIESEQKQIIAGVGSHSDDYSAGLNVRGEQIHATGIDYDNTSLNYNISNKIKFNSSEVKLNYKGNYEIRNQSADSNNDVFAVFGEEHTLEGTTPVDLLRANIVEASIEVWNENRTEPFDINVDYRIIQIGDQTQIQRLIGGSILDGQVVVVDYDYITGGTFGYDITGHNVDATWSVLRRYDLYARYRNTEQSLRDGSPDNVSLNSVESTTYGIKTERVLLNGMKIGGEIYRQNHQEDISPFIKDNLDYYIEIPLSKQTNIRFSGRKVIKDNEFSDEDTDLDGYILRIKSRPGLRVTSSFESSYEKDTGGTVERLLQTHRLLVRWRMRQLKFDASIRYSDEEQGPIVRDRWEAKLELRRDFF